MLPKVGMKVRAKSSLGNFITAGKIYTVIKISNNNPVYVGRTTFEVGPYDDGTAGDFGVDSQFDEYFDVIPNRTRKLPDWF